MSKPRAYVSEFQIQVGPLNALGKLVSVVKSGASKDSKYKSVCPTCAENKDANSVKQQYVCPDHSDHGPFVQRELTVKGRDVGDGELALVSAEEVTAARTSELPPNVFRATVHPRSDVEQYSFDADKAYVFVPRNPDDYFALLVEMVRQDENTFVATANVRNSEGFFRLNVWNGQLVLQKLLWPEDLNTFDEVDVEVDDGLRAAATEMIERISTPFDAKEYRSSVRERLAAINEALEAGNTPTAPATATTRTVDTKASLMDALTSFAA